MEKESSTEPENGGYAGRHILSEFWGVKNIDSAEFVESVLRKAVEASGATLLNLCVHKFNPQGISGLVLISESHISIHTWPEYGYMAVDVFTCGQTVKSFSVLSVLKEAFTPERVEVVEIKRGLRTKI
ncbi:MAG: adenosylmethionine decarboxylase [Candidatus Pacebacteria bacterium]|nr:adenosylmethionine decarboxylase [Candidatus Paceibacterota bacterium]